MPKEDTTLSTTGMESVSDILWSGAGYASPPHTLPAALVGVGGVGGGKVLVLALTIGG